MSTRRGYLGRTTRTPVDPCPNCGKALDATTGVNHRKKPRAGSISLCLCGHLSVFTAELTRRPPTDAEVIELAGNENMIRAQKALAALRASMEKK